MKQINLRELYPDTYKTDTYVEVTDEVLEAIKAQERGEATQERTIRRYKAYYSLDSENSIKMLFSSRPLSPDELLVERSVRDLLYAAVMSLPEKSAKRIYAHYYLGMSKAEIARFEGVHESTVRESIERGVHLLSKKLKNLL